MKINLSLIRSQFGFILNNYFLLLATGFHGQIDKILIAPILGFTVLGNFSLGMQFIGIMWIFSGVVFKYLLAQDASGVDNKQIKIYSVIGSSGIAIIGIIILPVLIPIFFPKFIIVVDAIQIMCLHIIPASLAVIFESKLLGQLKSRYVLLGRLTGLLVMICGMILLGTLYDIIGIAISLVLSSIVICIIFFFGTQKLTENKTANYTKF